MNAATPLGARGCSVIDVVGEANPKYNVLASSRWRFASCFRSLIRSWREAWMAGSGNGPFSFLYVQLAPWLAFRSGRLPGNVTSVRLGQADVQPAPATHGLSSTRADPVVDTGMVVTIDLGDRGTKTDVHPRNKSEVARRMAVLLRRVTYATYDDGTLQHPSFLGAHLLGYVAGGGGGSHVVTVSVALSHVGTDDKLVLRPTLKCIECCHLETAGKPSDMMQIGLSNTTVPADGWVNASVVMGDSGVITVKATLPTSAALSGSPLFVRYAASDYPECVVAKQQGRLPAGPFLAPVATGHAEFFEKARPASIRGPFRAARPEPEERSHGDAARVVAGGPQELSSSLSHLPPMGFNSWNRFHCDIDEQIIRATADALVSTGLAAAGFRYINLDDCWQVSRLPNGTIVASQSHITNTANYRATPRPQWGRSIHVSPQ